jgi:hypothetical protein
MNLTIRWPLCLLTASIAASAAPSVAPFSAFPTAKIESSPLSLIDNARLRMPPIFGDRVAFQPIAFQRPAHRPKLMARMPVIAPAGSVDYRLEIKAPNQDINYTLLVQPPDVELPDDVAR